MISLAGPAGLGPLELLIILGIVVVLFGASRIGDIGKGVGRGIREFRRELKDGAEEGETPEKEAVAKTESTDAAKEQSSYTQH